MHFPLGLLATLFREPLDFSCLSVVGLWWFGGVLVKTKRGSAGILTGMYGPCSKDDTIRPQVMAPAARMTRRHVRKLLNREVYQDSDHLFSFLLLENLAVPSYAST